MKRVLAWILQWPWALGTAIVLLWNRTRAGKRLLVRKYDLVSDRIPEGFAGLRIVQLTDLHGRVFGRDQSDRLRRVRALQPDLVLVTGDMYGYQAHTPEERAPITDLFRTLAENWPTYAILGNHEARDPDLPEIITDMRSTGIYLLRDQTAFITRGTDRLAVTGLETDDMQDMLEAEEEDLLRTRLDASFSRVFRTPADFTILMAHKPELLKIYAEYPADLIFSGHAHGGLLEIPFVRKRLLAPGQGFFPIYSHGVYRAKHSCMILSAGLGGPRFRIQPEIVCTVLHRRS